MQGLIRYLPRFGYRPVVLTPRLPGPPEKGFEVVETEYPGDGLALLKQRLGLRPDRGIEEQIGVPLAVREGNWTLVRRLKGLVFGALIYPDEQKAWYEPAVREGARVLEREPFAAIISSSGPETCHLIARTLSHRHGVPWLADLRDLWTQDHYRQWGSIRRRIEARLERRVLADADALVTVTTPFAQMLGQLHGRAVDTIPNGFEPQDLAEGPRELDEKLTIVHTGKLIQGHRNPVTLLRAVAAMIEAGEVDPSRIRVELYGRRWHWIQRQIRDLGLDGVAEQMGSIPRREVIARQRRAQLLVILCPSYPEERGVQPGKVFEYLAARRPILVVGGHRGALADLFAQTRAGEQVMDLAGTREALARAWADFVASGQVCYEGDGAEISKYSHVEMARRFANVLDRSVVQPRGSVPVTWAPGARGSDGEQSSTG